jgi:hypothetical protein
MLTYQNLEAIQNNDKAKLDFVKQVIQQHESSTLYQNAEIADEYIRGQNREAKAHVNYLTTATGKQIVDQWSPNTRTARSFFRILLMGDVNYILGNGVKWNDKEKTESIVGKDFDVRLSDLLTFAKAHGCAFGYFNTNHLEVFATRTMNGGFAPLYDSENGALRAGVKFWYFNEGKSLRANLYEESGITSYLWDSTSQENANGTILSDENTILDNGTKKPYRINYNKGAGYLPIEPGENYPGFPIIPLYGNSFHESELFMGLKDLIDEYDRLANSTANDLDTAMIYWIFQNAGGMDNADMAKALDQLRALKAISAEEGDVKPVTVNPPITERHAEMQRVERAIYDDYMGLNFKDIVSGAATATQIKAAYEPVKNKANDTEKCLLDFLYKLLAIAGIEDESPSFEPDPIKNVSEETNAIIAEAQFLPRDYTVSELLYLRGDGDKIPDILDELDKEDMQRMSGIGLDKEANEQEETEIPDNDTVDEAGNEQ